jgi:ATP synthase F1 delta subunit
MKNNDQIAKVYGKVLSQITKIVEDGLSHLKDTLASSKQQDAEFIIEQYGKEITSAICEKFFLLFGVEKEKVVAEVVTAVPLSDEITAKLENKLSNLTGKQVFLKTSMDKSIVGGFVIQIGGKVIDSSVRRKLEDLQKDMMALLSS